VDAKQRARRPRTKRRPIYQWARLIAQVAFAVAVALAAVHVSFLLLLILLGLGLIGGAWFCGWLCPLGTAQEWLGKLGRLLRVPRLRLPESVERIVAWLRFVLLGLSLAGIAALAFLSQPYQSFSGLLAGHTAYVELAAWLSLGLFLALSLLVDRPFCRYFCVEGAQYGAVSLLRVLTIRRHAATCTGCRSCDRACPAHIRVSDRPHVRSQQCVNCLECLSACPVKGALDFGPFWKKGERG
jgi:polyferredoxin